jgi:DNA-binding transcriptional MerR regulator
LESTDVGATTSRTSGSTPILGQPIVDQPIVDQPIVDQPIVDQISEVPVEDLGETGIRISDAATRAGVSARTLRYYEELGLLTPSLYTPGGERRYTSEDLAHLQRILELREVLGMNLDEIKEFLSLESRLDELRFTYRATKGVPTRKARAEQKAMLEEALVLNESLAEQIGTKLARMDAFRAKLAAAADRCRELLSELDQERPE